MSTIRATYVQHGSSAVPNITLNASGQVIVASGLVSSGTFAAPSGTAAAPGVYFDSDTDTGLYSPGANQVAISTSGTGRLFVDSSGNVGLGTSSPGSLFNLAANNDGVSTVTSANNRLRFTDTDTTVGSNFQVTGAIEFETSDASSPGVQAYVAAESSTTGFGNLLFGTGQGGSASTRMFIQSDGNVGVGNTAPGGLLHLGNGTNNSDIILDKPEAGAGTLKFFKGGAASAYIQYDASEDLVYYSPSGAGGHIFYTSGNEAARIDSSRRLLVGTSTSQGSYNLQCYGTGVWGQGAYVNGSDANIKQNIQDLEPALDVIKAMRPVTFQYKQEYSSDQTIQPGFIAQELQAAMAGKAYVDGVVQQGTTHLNVAYSSIIAVLVKAVQELEAKVAALENP